jgi:thymidylate kinase
MNTFTVFSGLDCSGKSTQIELLKKSFTEKGQKTIVFWSRGGYTPGFQKLKDIIRKFIGKKLPKPGHTPQRDKALSNPFIRKVWLTIAMLDLIYYYSIYLRVNKLLNYNIICDRYLMDTNIDFKLTYPMEKTDKWFLWKVLKLSALKPDFHFVSTIPVSESVIRSKFKFEPYPDSPETLNLRLELYNEELNKAGKLNFIDGMNDKMEIRDNILSIVSKWKKK